MNNRNIFRHSLLLAEFLACLEPYTKNRKGNDSRNFVGETEGRKLLSTSNYTLKIILKYILEYGPG
jgi:hypothetical protein